MESILSFFVGVGLTTSGFLTYLAYLETKNFKKEIDYLRRIKELLE